MLMRELQRQLEKYVKEKEALDNLTPRIDKRRSELGNQIRAIQQLLQGSETIERSAIPQEVFDYLDNYLPPINGVGPHESAQFKTSELPSDLDPSNKTYLILALFYHSHVTTPAGGVTSGEVFDLVRRQGYAMSKDDVYKVLSRQVPMARLRKQDNKFYLTEKGARIVKTLAIEAAGEK